MSLLAATPILLVVGLMLGLRWSAARAGLAGLVGALLLGWTAFDLQESGGTEAVIGAASEALFTAVLIGWIIVPALAIHRLQSATGSVDRLRAALTGLSGDPRISAILIAWFFALLIEGAAGFGTAAALAAPFLVGLGMSPISAVVVALLGHTVGVSFGAIGTPVVPQTVASGLDPIALSASVARHHAIVSWVLPLIVGVMVARAFADRVIGGRPPLLMTAAFAGVCFGLPFVATASIIGPELPTLGGALVGGTVFVAVLVSLRRGSSTHAERPGWWPTLRAAAPYLVLLALVIATRLIEPLQASLSGLRLEWSLGDRFGGGFAPLYHPGTMLALALLVGGLLSGGTSRQVGGAVVATLRRMGPVALALVAMLGMSRLMVHAGMIDTLAAGAADAVGPVWPMVTPAVGALGMFVTGSATASNVLFSDLHVATSAASRLDTAAVLGAANFGAAIGNAVAPHNIIAAAAVVGVAGSEASVLRRTLGPVLLLLLVGGMVGLLLA